MNSLQHLSQQVLGLVLKDLRREWRSKEILTTTIAFALLLMLIFTFSFYQGDRTTPLVFPGLLWVSIAFSGSLAVGRTFLDEKESGCLRALALIPGMSKSLYMAKFLTNFVFLCLFEIVLVPLLVLSFDPQLSGHWGLFALSVLAGTLGLTAMGTLMAAMLVHHRLREVMLPIIMYPLLMPLFIGGTKSVGALMGEGQLDVYWMWLKLMLGMDAVFLIGAQWMFKWVLESIE